MPQIPSAYFACLSEAGGEERSFTEAGHSEMTKFNNAMEIFKLLDKSNCRECGKPTCLAFAGAVLNGTTSLGECPKLDKAILAKYGDIAREQRLPEQIMEQTTAQFRSRIAETDLKQAADRLGAEYGDGRLTIRCLGKEVSVDSQGDIHTDIHVHGWLVIPVYSYILDGKGIEPTGEWVPFRELPGGKERHLLFNRRSEQSLKRIADTYTDLFEDMVHLFNGRQVENHYQSDISMVLRPLPKVPILVCYWRPEEGMESDLNIFFDANAEENLNIDPLYTLATGLVVMFEKISQRHG